ncbi:glycoside hydrolase family 19 protein [Pseudomonas fluorescens group sp.]|uniref:Phage encoded lysozyme n=2 Tax=Pseudomonas fluorescens TaxID=294 RepID=C3JZM4_PSEFS|nr:MULTISPECIES: glycoside hydrolase family 19 protein [Pseudomonas fluorescens group]MBZ6456686.1 glycoside hydrolase family 19 protein [Pseudomonas fluorescens group sp.]MBZ6462633.1 glycoside hydrolase family 19 protein [Pseudomonas fluorescens group sp.]MBZ6468774.1 glycoside hydrolase family 19 protein [Pseudomonas fluorescens group sp.]WQD70466.1 glycoside hydrolase family 19 protein [Pseudomonas marginalis]CAI2798330.1 Putative phage encoded lysozyme [Pseudomonas fluorescens SBW25]
MPLTEQQLLQILPNAGRQAGVFVPVLNAAMNRYGIVGAARVSAFIAQVGHESGQLRYVREIWGPTAQQAGYEGRADLGNTLKGDGSKYRGRGLLQITGRANYAECGDALGLDLVNQPTLLEQPQHAAMSAAWFWSAEGLNTLADQGAFVKITRRINGGLNGQTDRQALYAKALKVLA